MIHIALDTSGIGKTKSQKEASYLALKRLIKANQLTIHAPYVVKRELETQELEYYLKEYRLLKESLRKFLRVPKSEVVHKIINDIQKKIEESEDIINSDAEFFSRSWLSGLNANIQQIDNNQTISALEAYFKGSAPLTSPKNREDIPDSFICRGIEEIKKRFSNLVVIANDKKIVNTFSKLPNYSIFHSVEEFILSTHIQEKLQGLDIIDSQIGNLLSFIQRSEIKNPIIHDFLADKISDEIWNIKIHDISYSNDENEATISSAYTGSNITLDLKNPIHYGEDQIGFRFDLEVEAEIEYFIDKHEYYSRLENEWAVYVSDWNDHVFEASETRLLHVSGIVSIKFDTTSLNLSEISQLDEDEFDDYFHDVYREAELNIESIEEIVST
ncbi:PIN domain-containing protein [Acinetobacter towneri]|uniref:PIN domain-containing protein n=1 Tax=Acinetobacter towneri TaxID=202956 RepID=UPI000378C431